MPKTQAQDLMESARRAADPNGEYNNLSLGLELLDVAQTSVEPGSRESLWITGTRGILLLWHGFIQQAHLLFSRILLAARYYGDFPVERWAYDWLRLAQLCVRSAPST